MQQQSRVVCGCGENDEIDRSNHHSLIIILITFAEAGTEGGGEMAARKWILWSVLRTVVPNINCCQFQDDRRRQEPKEPPSQQAKRTEQKDRKDGSQRSKEGTTDCHVNSIFVLPCAATSFSQFLTHSSPPRLLASPHHPVDNQPWTQPTGWQFSQRHFMYIIINTFCQAPFTRRRLSSSLSLIIADSHQSRVRYLQPFHSIPFPLFHSITVFLSPAIWSPFPELIVFPNPHSYG